MLTSIADKIVPIGLELIVYKLVSVLTSIADKIETEFYLDRYKFEKPSWSRAFTA